MTTALFRDTLRAIRHTLSRFVSIVIIVALGVGFFAGLKAVSPNMKQAATDFYAEHRLADIIVASTAGFDAKDAEAVLALPGVESATLSRSIDGILYKMSEEDTMEQSMSGTSYVIRIIGYDFSQAVGTGSARRNQLSLVAGRWPEPGNNRECVVSEYANKKEPDHYVLNQVINIRGDHEELLDTVSSEYYKVVGVVHTPEFVAMELGASTAGGGELSGYIYIQDSAFKMENEYTTMYIAAEGAAQYPAYTGDYNAAVRSVVETLEKEKTRIVKARANRVQSNYGPQIEQAKLDLQTAKTDGKAQLERARKDIQELREGVEMGPKEIEEGRKKLEQAKKDYAQGQIDYNKGLAQYNENSAKYAEKVKEVEAQDIPNKLVEYENGKSKLERAEYSFELAQMGIKAGKSAVRVGKSAVESGEQERIENAMAILGQYFPLEESDYTVEGLQVRIDEAEADLARQEEALKDQEAELEEGRRQLKEAEGQLADYRKFEQAGKDINAAKAKLDKARAELEAAPGEIARRERELAEAERRLAGGISLDATADQDLARAEAQYEQKVADAERRIRRYENQMAALENAQWIVTDRDGFPGYTNYGDTSDSMELFAVVFPVLFILVALLMSLTTMTRMVEEERMQIGVLKASGYSGLGIAFKYLFYASTAAVTGSVLGLVPGITLLPLAIFKGFQILYLIPTMHPGFYPDIAAVGVGVALASTLSAAVFSVALTLRNRPAQLLRPKAPKAGKRVFLEYFPFIWRRLGFNGKVTVRNLMRKKTRFAMTFFGILGCTALILTGFGIGNSLGTMLDKQFGPESIMRFDAQVMLQASKRPGDNKPLQVFKQPGRIRSILPVYMMKTYAGTESFGRQLAVTIVVPEVKEVVNDFVRLADEKTGELLPFTDAGAFINGKTAELMNLQVGDAITIQSGNLKARVPVAAITHNYVYHWIYLSPACYEHFFGVEEAAFNTVLLQLEPELNRSTGGQKAINEAKAMRAQLARDLSDTAEVITVAYTQIIVNSVGSMLNIFRLVIVAVCTIFSGLLAFAVLYNLNNINIYERVRELATIKVLGFYDKEADMFIYRENIIISILGILGGLALGVPMHGFIIRSIEIESMMFVRSMDWTNFVYAAVITVVFATAINAMMHKRIKDINMVEALKSVE